MVKHYVNSYNFDPRNKCYCGSQEPFGRCCGIKKVERRPPAGITIIPDFFEPDALRELAKNLKKLPKQPLGTVEANPGDSKNVVVRRDPGRITETIVADASTQTQLNSMVCAAIAKKVQPFTQDVLTHIEVPHILYYKKGGKYDQHSDSENFDKEANRFFQFIDRHFSFLIYLNDGYEGGNLKFNYLNYTYRPKAGEALCFPSGHIFTHQSTPVRRGYKMAIATWGIIQTAKRIGTPLDTATHIKL